MFAAKVLADSIHIGNRITTMELTYPRFVHSEFMTHRSHSRNAASSRAIPVTKMMADVESNPVIPIHWGRNEKGMQANSELDGDDRANCLETWLAARDNALRSARSLVASGLHKQIANRILEPWMWITVIATANSSGWENWFKLRCHPEAEPHIAKIAYMSRELFDANQPCSLSDGEWHTPLVGFPGDEELSEADLAKVSIARCARVSYLTHAGIRDVEADLQLYDRLKTSGHFSPFEHVAQASFGPPSGNLGMGWTQYRKTLPNEFCTKAPR